MYAACTGTLTDKRESNQQGYALATTITFLEHTTGWIICLTTRVYDSGATRVAVSCNEGWGCSTSDGKTACHDRAASGGRAASHFLRLRSLAVITPSILASPVVHFLCDLSSCVFFHFLDPCSQSVHRVFQAQSRLVGHVACEKTYE